MNPGIIGAVIGSAAGLAGGAYGCYCSVRNARGPLAKRFMLRCSVGMLAFVALFVAGTLFIPPRERWLPFVLLAVVLPMVISVINRKFAKLEGGAAPVGG